MNIAEDNTTKKQQKRELKNKTKNKREQMNKKTQEITP
jgi:hypothetical protein